MGDVGDGMEKVKAEAKARARVRVRASIGVGAKWQLNPLTLILFKALT